MTNEIEILSLESIQASGIAPYNTITRTLGLDEEQWDCWINHFYDYDWSELVDEELGLYFEALGWTQTSWDNDDAANFPESNDKFWVELTDLEKEAANYLCFFPELWDATLTIPEWTYDPVTGTGGTAVQPPTPSPAPSTPAPEIKKAKIAPPAKCGSLADAAGRGGAAAQAKDCTSRNGNGRKLRVKGSKRTTYYD